MVIKPTVGRVVWFWQGRPAYPEQQPQAAMIARVWSDTCVNLAIFDPNGNPVPNPPTSIRLLQEGEELPETGHYATWMPFQVGQARVQSK